MNAFLNRSGSAVPSTSSIQMGFNQSQTLDVSIAASKLLHVDSKLGVADRGAGACNVGLQGLEKDIGLGKVVSYTGKHAKCVES